MTKSKLIKFFNNYVITFFLYSNLVLVYLLVKKYSNFLEPFEDEITSLISGVSFLQNLDFNGSPLINGNYSPFLTSGPIASIGSGLGWILTKDFSLARISNFYFLALLIYTLLNLSKIFNNKSQAFILNITLISLTIVPWWFGSLYSLGEMFSSALFVLSILLLNTYKNLGFFIMSFSIIFGKLIQILLVIPFVIVYLLTIKKINYINILNFLLPIFIYISLLYFKIENFNFSEYFTSYFEIIYNHQSSGLKVVSLFSLENLVDQLKDSEFMQWTLVTKIRVLITPIIFIFIVLINKEKFNSIFGSSYAIIFAIVTPYLWFLMFSQTKWVRYSQHFLYLILFLSIVLLFSETKLSSYTTIILVLNLSLFLSSEILLVMFLGSILFLKNTIFFKKILLIVLIFNSLNLLFESQNLINYNLNFESCKKSITSFDCVEDYLPYKFFK